MTVLSPSFVIGHIQVGSLEGASCINIGNNFPSHFTSNKKHNQGFGNVGGDGNTISDGRMVLNDPDVLDLLTVSGEQDVPDWLKEMIHRALPDNGEFEGEAGHTEEKGGS
jgi:hypothetical protein